jgi:DNA replication protein DnaC
MNEGAALPQLLKELRLPTIGSLWEILAEEALEKGWSPVKYLRRLMEHESADRERRRLARHMSQSRLPHGKSIETFDFSLVSTLNKGQVMGLASGDLWLEQGKNVLIFGPSGVGKTHLAAAIGEQLILAGHRILFIRTTELLQLLANSKKEYSLPAALDKLDKYDCLILDDFGYVQKSEAETSLLFELICERYECRSLMITCNQPFKEWDRIFSDKRMAVAAIDRLVHHSILLEMNVESYRKRAALNASQKL